MDSSEFKYDVALSFIAADEEIATQIHDSLAGEVNTFLYSKRQEVLAGKDGFDAFSSVFSKESRVNVVLYRTEWSKAGWTRVEATAIKSRIFGEGEDGWDSLIVVKLDDESKLPIWIPKTYIYVKWSQYGLEGTSAIIKYKVQELGGQIRKESLEDYARRVQRENRLGAEIKEYEEGISSTAVTDAESEIRSLFDECEKQWNVVRSLGVEMHFGRTDRKMQYIKVPKNGNFLIFVWHHNNINSLMDSYLEVRIYRLSNFTEHHTEDILEVHYRFGLNKITEKGWKSNDGGFFTSKQIVDNWTKYLINY